MGNELSVQKIFHGIQNVYPEQNTESSYKIIASLIRLWGEERKRKRLRILFYSHWSKYRKETNASISTFLFSGQGEAHSVHFLIEEIKEILLLEAAVIVKFVMETFFPSDKLRNWFSSKETNERLHFKFHVD